MKHAEAQPVARANADAWHVGCGAAFGAKHRRGSSVTLGKTVTKRLLVLGAKVALVGMFLYAAFIAARGPAGHLEPWGSAPVGTFAILLAGAIVVSGKWKKLHVHLIWGSLFLATFLALYREYCYERMNSQLYRQVLERQGKLRIPEKKE